MGVSFLTPVFLIQTRHTILTDNTKKYNNYTIKFQKSTFII
jgi:hypothetical protein